MDQWWIWLGIAVCLSQSAMLSGLNLAVFSLSRLRLEAAAESGDRDARRVLELRQDANYTLATILWGNVAVNVLLTLLAESVMAGVAAFLFSTVVITLAAEIFPQAYFSRHALRVAAFLSPVLRLYRIVLWPVARPVGKLLDFSVGREAIPWFREEELTAVLEHHAREPCSEVGHVEATGAVNFLALDDILVSQEGEPLDPDSIVRLPFRGGHPVFPAFDSDTRDPFLRQVASSGKRWIVVVDGSGRPGCVFRADAFLSAALFGKEGFDPVSLCHHPLVITDGNAPMGRMLSRLTVRPDKPGDDVIDADVMLVWTESEQRIITGPDILGRLLRRIARTTQEPRGLAPDL